MCFGPVQCLCFGFESFAFAVMPYFELAGYGFDILLWIAYYTDTIASLDGCQEKCPLKNMLQLCGIGLITVAQLIILMPCAGVTNRC